MKTYHGGHRKDGRVEVWISEPDAAYDQARTLPHVVSESPSGFEYGYQGSGPTDLALSILAEWFEEGTT